MNYGILKIQIFQIFTLYLFANTTNKISSIDLFTVLKGIRTNCLWNVWAMRRIWSFKRLQIHMLVNQQSEFSLCQLNEANSDVG